MPSCHQVLAIERLRESWFINWMVRGSLHDPSMGGSSHHPNWRFFSAMEQYLSVQQICHAGDTLNSYCDSILADILHASPSEWTNVKTLLRRTDLQDTIDRLRNHRQLGAREALRDGITTFWSPESDVIIALRNKLVHQGGHDKDREVEKMIASKNGQWCSIYPMDLPKDVVPIAYSGDDLVVDAQTGAWACRHVQNHIHIMDQSLCHRFSLPTMRQRSRSLNFTWHSDQRTLPFPPGTPLPTAGPPNRQYVVVEVPLVNPDYSQLMDEQEIGCAQTRVKARDDLDRAVRAYCEEQNVALVGGFGGAPGSLFSNTMRFHDLNLIYKLQEKDSTGSKSHLVEIRVRERDFKPFLTVFGHNSQMKDFSLPEGFDAGLEYAKACIDKALQA